MLTGVTLNTVGAVTLAALMIIFIGIMLEIGSTARTLARRIPRRAPTTSLEHALSLDHTPVLTNVISVNPEVQPTVHFSRAADLDR